jgi:hypothetical protein
MCLYIWKSSTRESQSASGLELGDQSTRTMYGHGVVTAADEVSADEHARHTATAGHLTERVLKISTIACRGK